MLSSKERGGFSFDNVLRNNHLEAQYVLSLGSGSRGPLERDRRLLSVALLLVRWSLGGRVLVCPSLGSLIPFFFTATDHHPLALAAFLWMDGLFYLLWLRRATFPWHGFLCGRRGYTMPKPVKTGTTIAGVVFADGIVLGADTRYVGSLLAHRGHARQSMV